MKPSELRILKGFGPGRVKEFFVVTQDGDTFEGLVAGPFESWVQADGAKDALRPLYPMTLLGVMGGHLEGWQDKPW